MKRKQFLKSLTLAPFPAAFPALVAPKTSNRTTRKTNIRPIGFIKHRAMIQKSRQVGIGYPMNLNPWQIAVSNRSKGGKTYIRYDGGEWEDFLKSPDRKLTYCMNAELGIYESDLPIITAVQEKPLGRIETSLSKLNKPLEEGTASIAGFGTNLTKIR